MQTAADALEQLANDHPSFLNKLRSVETVEQAVDLAQQYGVNASPVDLRRLVEAASGPDVVLSNEELGLVASYGGNTAFCGTGTCGNSCGCNSTETCGNC